MFWQAGLSDWTATGPLARTFGILLVVLSFVIGLAPAAHVLRWRRKWLCALAALAKVSGGSTLHDPIADPQFEHGKLIEELAGMLNEFGSWLGGSIYDWTH